MAKNRTFGDGELYNINSYRFKVDNPVQQQRIGIDNDVPYVLLQRGARPKPDRIVVDMNSDFTDEMIAGLDVDANGNVLVKTAYPTATNIYGNSTGLIIDKSTDYFIPK
jgi:hypothetical protein